MHYGLKQQWQALKHGRPGRRFESHYEAARRARKSATWAGHARRVLRLLLALALIVVGLVLTVMPGPAILFFFLAGGLLAAESRDVARVLDWAEVRLRAVWDWGLRHWRKLPVWGKGALGTLVAGLSLTGTYLAYCVLTP